MKNIVIYHHSELGDICFLCAVYFATHQINKYASNNIVPYVVDPMENDSDMRSFVCNYCEELLF